MTILCQTKSMLPNIVIAPDHVSTNVMFLQHKKVNILGYIVVILHQDLRNSLQLNPLQVNLVV